MAGYDETVIPESLQRMALEDAVGFDEVKVDLEKVAATFIDQVRKLVMDNPKHFAGEFLIILKDGIDEIHKEKASKAPVDTGKAAAVIQAEKMDKAPAEVQTDKALVDGEEELVEMGKEAKPGWWDVSVGENGRYRLPDDYVRSILAFPRSTSHEEIDFAHIPNLPQHLVESLEKDRQLLYGEEAAARSKRINDNLELFQDKFRKELDRQGYVEVDEEFITNMNKARESCNELCKEQDDDFPYSDPNDPAYASWYI